MTTKVGRGNVSCVRCLHVPASLIVGHTIGLSITRRRSQGLRGECQECRLDSSFRFDKSNHIATRIRNDRADKATPELRWRFQYMLETDPVHHSVSQRISMTDGFPPEGLLSSDIDFAETRTGGVGGVIVTVRQTAINPTLTFRPGPSVRKPLVAHPSPSVLSVVREYVVQCFCARAVFAKRMSSRYSA